MSDDIFNVKKDKARAEDLYFRAKDRFEFIPFYPKDKTYKIIEESYESIKELLTSLMYLEGYKTLSHIKLIEFIQGKFNLFENKELKMKLPRHMSRVSFLHTLRYAIDHSP